jgi:predicted nucleic acid-binding protein
VATYLLDTSAWLAHVFDEPGADEVTALFADAEATIAISVLSILETQARFRAKNRVHEFREMLETYRLLFTRIYPAGEAVILGAIALREASTGRLPAMDSLIAATAAYHHATLVHRDPHFGGLPPESVVQLRLGDGR